MDTLGLPSTPCPIVSHLLPYPPASPAWQHLCLVVASTSMGKGIPSHLPKPSWFHNLDFFLGDLEKNKNLIMCAFLLDRADCGVFGNSVATSGWDGVNLPDGDWVPLSLASWGPGLSQGPAVEHAPSRCAWCLPVCS